MLEEGNGNRGGEGCVQRTDAAKRRVPRAGYTWSMRPGTTASTPASGGTSAVCCFFNLRCFARSSRLATSSVDVALVRCRFVCCVRASIDFTRELRRKVSGGGGSMRMCFFIRERFEGGKNWRSGKKTACSPPTDAKSLCGRRLRSPAHNFT